MSGRCKVDNTLIMRINSVHFWQRVVAGALVAMISIIGVTQWVHAEQIRVLASVDYEVDLEVGGSWPPVYTCTTPDVLDEWRIYEGNEFDSGSWMRKHIWTIPFDGSFPWRMRSLVGNFHPLGTIYYYELRPVCKMPDGETYEEPAIAETSAKSGWYNGTLYFDTLIGSNGVSNPKVGSLTIMSAPECFTGDTGFLDCPPQLVISGVVVEPEFVITARDGDIAIEDTMFKGSVDVYGGNLSIINSTFDGHLESRSLSVGGPIKYPLILIKDSTFKAEMPIFRFDESLVQLLDSTFTGQGVPVIGRITRTGRVEIQGSTFRDGRITDPGVRTDLLEIDCVNTGCDCQILRNEFESFGDDLVLKIGNSTCDVHRNTLWNTRFGAQEGQFNMTSNDFSWTTPPDGAVVVASVGPAASVRDNIFRGVDVTGLVVYGEANDFTMTGNSFCVPHAAGTALQNLTSGTLDVAANYWGHPTGPWLPPTYTGEGSAISGPVDYQPFLTSGSCGNWGSVFIENVQLVQGIPTTNLVAGKPVVLRVFLGNSGNDSISGVSITGSMAGKKFTVSGLHVPPEYSWSDVRKGKNSVNIVDLPLPVEGFGEVQVKVHYLDPELKFPVIRERTLAYSASVQRALKIAAIAVGVLPSELKTTFKKQLPLLRAIYPTHKVMIFKLTALASQSNARSAFAWMWIASKYSDMDVMVGVVPVSDMYDFDASWGNSVLIWPHIVNCNDVGTLGLGGESSFVLSHAVAHGLIGAADEHYPDNPTWNYKKFPYGHLVESGWDVFRGKSGLIHSNDPDDPLAGACDDYTPGDTGHSCNFYNFMATRCLPPKWISPGMRDRLFNHLSAVPQPSPVNSATVAATPVAALAIPVTVWEDGTGQIGALHDMVATPSDPNTVGLWTVATRNVSGTILDQASFNIAFRDTDPDRSIRFGGRGVVLPTSSQVAEVVLLQGTNVIDSITRDGSPPAVTLLSPNGGESLNGVFTAQWSASDVDSDPLSFILMLSCEAGEGWVPVAMNITGNSLTLDTEDLSGGDTCDFRVIASDGKWSTMDDSDASFSVAGHPPEVQILSPVAGESYEAGTEVNLAGLASVQDGDEFAMKDYLWNSDLIGPLGTGPRLTVDQLSAGNHNLTLTVTDSGALQGSATVSIVVVAAVDDDQDGLPDWWENLWGTQLGVKDDAADPDTDGLTNAEELAQGTDPLTADSDSDGWQDGEEVLQGADPLDPEDNPSVLLADDFETGDLSRWSETIP